MQPPLCSCLKAWAPNLPSWQTLKHTTMIEGHPLGLFLPHKPLLSFIHPWASAIPNWVQLQWCIQVFKINLKPERGSAGCRLTNSALNTNTDCFGRRLCVAIPYVPAEYAVTYLLYFSSSRRPAAPLPSSYSSSRYDKQQYGTVLSLCLEAGRWGGKKK